MAFMDHFRLPMLGRAAPPPPVPDAGAAPSTRLDRVVARCTARAPTDLQRGILSLEEEYSEPLYDSSAYGSPDASAPEA
jgi:hypothetical protein